ncbi:NAD-dependent epimerase/dehydratase family protein [Zavarzinia sp. CC-PAN008]|uniref:NAD-dependent epimerase/dehydratase family protein n=1 Tax=Zavarzinia sp. CC-PAN008 TaxID=3243332 RepID=UPI003F7426F5
MANVDGGDLVLVTGGSGYIAGWVIVELLRRGYRVRATLRSLSREAEVRAAIATQLDAAGRLEFAVADLLSDEGWGGAMQGVRFVQHVASPLGIGEYSGKDLVSPARDGAGRVLRAARTAGVARVVMTSSVVAAEPPASGGTASDETVWSAVDALDDTSYTRSKTLAEREAWAIAEREGLALTTILPAFVQGPVLGPDIGGSVTVLQRLLKGAMPRLPRLGFTFVDVRDLAALHVDAMTASQAAGQRLIAAGEFLWLADVAQILRSELGEQAARVPTKLAPDFLVRLGAMFDRDLRQVTPNLGLRRVFSAGKAEHLLGWRSRPARQSILDAARSLIAIGAA